MDVDRFLDHYGIEENPFGAEEARHDPVFERLILHANRKHPDFAKILGTVGHPNTSVVFGEKGSGKTAIRILIGRKVGQHNETTEDSRALLVAYDDWNPVLDLVARNRGGRRVVKNPDVLLKGFRLEDHQDAILSLAVTKLVDGLLRTGPAEERMRMPKDLDSRMRGLSRRLRVDVAVLGALYDQPRTGGLGERWRDLRRRLRLGWRLSVRFLQACAVVFSVVAVGLLVAPKVSGWFLSKGQTLPGWVVPAGWVFAAAAVLLWGVWIWRALSVWSLARRIRKEMPAVDRSAEHLRRTLKDLSRKDRSDQPWPVRGADDTNTRYELTRKLLRVLEAFGYTGVIVLVDRVDEPTLVAGRPERMRELVWPMMDSKFLQQERVGIKLLLPLELRYLVHRESAEFFQEARLDKQNLVDRLTWSGATLYDLCTDRLHACQKEDAQPVALTDLFEQDVTREVLVEALEQMHQPRDAFKFLYSVLQEHCRMVPEEEARYKIPRLTLESVRRDQAQRVQELYRGLSPA